MFLNWLLVGETFPDSGLRSKANTFQLTRLFQVGAKKQKESVTLELSTHYLPIVRIIFLLHG